MPKPRIFLILSLLLAGQIIQAQVSDDFGDGEFTSNPTWVGSQSVFVAENQVLRSNSATANNYYLSTPNQLIDDTQWEFWINLNFSTSGANYVEVYLVADNPDLNSAQNGYFLRIGNTSDEISLYRKAAGVETEILDGTDGVTGSSGNNIFVVRITRSQEGLWNVEYDEDATGSFVSGGSVIDNQITSTQHFGVRIVQSTAASAVGNHFFDDFSVGPIPVDESAPELISASAPSSSTIVVNFSEELDPGSAEDEQNYFIDGGIGNPSSAASLGSGIVELTTGVELVNGSSYTLTVNGVSDLAGNATSNASVDFTFFIPATAQPGDVVFNELLPDPTPVVGLPEAEFIELYNASSLFFDMENWVLVNTSTEKVLGQRALPPGEFLILCDESDIGLFQDFGPVLGIPSFTALSNSGDSLTLRNPDGTVIDIVSYSLDWYGDPDKDDGGYSLELINPFAQCSGQVNWAASDAPSGGTPGGQNSIFDNSPDLVAPELISYALVNNGQSIVLLFSEELIESSISLTNFSIDQDIVINEVVRTEPNQVVLNLNEPLIPGIPYELTFSGLSDCEGNVITEPQTIAILSGEEPQPGDLIISEIMADPTPAVGLPEGEYFELYNLSNKTLELQGSEISGVIFSETVIMEPGQYLVFASTSNSQLFQDLPGFRFLEGMSTSFLTNTGKELILENASGLIIDFVEYTDDWYNDPDKDDGGYSLELINPTAACSGSSNWSASNAASGGTPGQQNSIFDDSPDLTPPSLLGFGVQGNSVELFFSEPLDPAASASLEVSITPEIAVNNVFLTQATVLLVDLAVAPDIGVVYEIEVSPVQDCEGNSTAGPVVINILLGEPPLFRDILITEIMADPSPSQGLPEAEYFELYNASNKTIDLAGSSISGVEFTSVTIISPGEYLFFAAEANAENFLLSFPEVVLLEEMSTTFLTNGGKELILRNPEGGLVDRVNYSIDWYEDPDKTEGGFSLERINLAEPCRAGDNWRGSEAETGGTPGQENSILSNEADQTPPQVLSAFALNSSTVEIRFNEVIDSVSVLLAEFSFAPKLEIESIEMGNSDNTSLRIVVNSPLESGLRYEVVVENLSDCTGNVLSASQPEPFALPEPGGPGDLIINEVLFNPRTGAQDFVEIVNISDKNIGLQSWVLQNRDFTTRTISSEPVVIFPGQYLVFTSDAQNLIQEYPMGRRENFLEMESLPSYNNGAGSVILADSLQNIVDRFDYREEYHFPLLNSFKGVSLERLSFTRPTNEAGNWSSAAENVGFATPGYLNSQYLPEGRANANFEVQDDVFSPDNDGFEDVLYINYLLDEPGFAVNITIHDSRGRKIRQLTNNLLVGTEGTISWDGTTDDRSKARIGAYIILIEAFTPSGTKEIFKIPCVVAGNLSN